MKIIFYVVMVILTSFFFFPFEFTFSPGVNTKMMLAVVGGIIFFWSAVFTGKVVIPQIVFVATFIACIFSFTVFYAIYYSNTNDYSYTAYVVSMLVWLIAAYAVCYLISRIHGYISVKLVINYLIAVCVAQCILALLIDKILAVQRFFEIFVAYDVKAMEKFDRLYGVGAMLDVAGTRFSAVLVMIAMLLFNDNAVKSNKKTITVYVCMFVVITVVGSMISRTTNIGMLVAFGYLIYASRIWAIQVKSINLRVWGVVITVMFFIVLICTFLYKNVAAANELLRFAFEGFFNWIETGEWKTHSTDILKSMWVYPETFKTWIIGDGYFLDPISNAFYMTTDVGYLRFIFYCGIQGLAVFSAFFIYLSIACYKIFPQERQLFVLLLIIVFAVWAKVATDIFLVYALFICIPMVQEHIKPRKWVVQ